jgi:hypothetical protein
MVSAAARKVRCASTANSKATWRMRKRFSSWGVVSVMVALN